MNETNLPRVTPYRGEEPYIFISYSHKDSDRVLPVLAELTARGYRVWYDEGIDPGTEWDAMIATQLMNCAYFIPFITKNYLASENCMDELHLAREESLPRFLVYLEDVALPPAQRMRLGRIQNIHKYTYQNEEEFYDKFAHAEGLDVCKCVTASPTKPAEDSLVFRKDEPKQAPVEDVPNASDFIIDQAGCLVKYTGPGGDVVIPDGVTKIGMASFDRCTSLTSVTIPDSVTKIGISAFSLCTSLTSIKIPNSITKIDGCAFDGCVRLTSVTIPDGVTKISAGTFSLCKRLTSVRIPNSITEIENNAFKDCTSLTSIKIPDSVTEIGGYAFNGCTNLTIHAPTGSYALEYAEENGIPFAAEITPHAEAPVMIVEDVFTITGRGTVITGTVEHESISVGDILSVGGKSFTVSGIEMFRKLLDTAHPGDSVGILLKDAKRNDDFKPGDSVYKKH